jgi:hypothetical protein
LWARMRSLVTGRFSFWCDAGAGWSWRAGLGRTEGACRPDLLEIFCFAFMRKIGVIGELGSKGGLSYGVCDQTWLFGLAGVAWPGVVGFEFPWCWLAWRCLGGRAG